MPLHIWIASLLIMLLTWPAMAADDRPVRLHDPHIIKCQNAWYIFSTGRGIPILQSHDLSHWQPVGRVFHDDLPPWAKEKIPAATGIWAPDILLLNGRFHLYYTVSTFGNNQSCIGLATNVTLDPSDPNYQWLDQGLVIQTQPLDDFNAIDAGPVLDDRGQPWLVFGSFWSGIKLIRLDSATGKISTGSAPIPLAARPGVVNNPIEAPCMIRRNGYYYLFVSFDYCGQGVSSTYNIRVGRSKSITGPYVDTAGIPMLNGGGTPVMNSHGDIRGPGHNSILIDGEKSYLVNHYYDARSKGAPTLLISPLTWDAEGWPHPSDPIPTSLINAPPKSQMP